MKRVKLGSLAVLAALAAGLALGGLSGGVSGQEGDAKKAAEEALKKAVENGRKLFGDKTLGTKGKACAKCHEDPERPKLSLAARANTYPKWDRREGKVITLGQKINQMIVRMLKGKAEVLGSERLVAIEAHLMKISRDR